MSAVDSHRRVMALADLAHRYGGVLRGLLTAVEEVISDVEPEVRERLLRATGDADAQVAAISDALSKAPDDDPAVPDDWRDEL